MVEVDAGRVRGGVSGELPWPDFDPVVLEQFLELADVDEHGALLALELLQIASPLGAARDAIGDIAVEVLRGAMRTAFWERIATDLAYLQMDCQCLIHVDTLRA
jgi:hypothetical protein